MAAAERMSPAVAGRRRHCGLATFELIRANWPREGAALWWGLNGRSHHPRLNATAVSSRPLSDTNKASGTRGLLFPSATDVSRTNVAATTDHGEGGIKQTNVLHVAPAEGMRRRSYWPAVQKGVGHEQGPGASQQQRPTFKANAQHKHLFAPAPPSRKNQNLG